MRMLAVADRIASLGHIDGIVRHHLDVLALDYALLFRRDHIRDPGLPRLEIVAELLHLVALSAVLHHRLSLDLPGSRVLRAPRVKGVVFQVIFHIVGRQFH